MRRRIIVCLGLLFVLCLLGDTIAMVCLHRSINRLSKLAESHRIQSLRADLASSGVRVEKDLLAFLSGHDLDFEQRPDSLRRFQASADQCTRCHHEPVIASELNAIYETFRAYQDRSTRLFAGGEPRAEGGDIEEREALGEEALELAHRLVAQTTEIADRAGKHVTIKSADARASIRNAWLVLSGTLVAILVAGGVVAFHLKRRLNVPIAALLDGIERIRQGDTTHRFVLDGDAEFRALGHALNEAYSSVKSAHDSVLQAEKMATAGRLAAGVAHEVGNPLASISAVAQVMRPLCTSEEQTRQINLIMGEVARISRIVRELLTFSRPGVPDRHTRVDIGALLEHATNLVRYDKRAERIAITCHQDEELPCVLGNADRLLLAFTNIMINALDAMSINNGDASGSLTITAGRQDSAVTVRFVDTGSGMTEQQVAEAFEPFFTTKEPGVGTGLGLWVCYQVVDAHKGEIDIISRPGEGTTVTVALPIESASDG